MREALLTLALFCLLFLFGSIFGASTTLRFQGDQAYALAKNDDEGELDLVIFQWRSVGGTLLLKP